MKLKQNTSSILRQIFKAEQDAYLIKPNPPTAEAIEKAKFIDKTYKWTGSAANKAANSKPTN